MKYLLILSCLLFTSVGWSKDVSLDDLVQRDGLYYEKFTKDPFTGNVVGKEQGKISKGKIDGEWISYWDNGQLMSQQNYKDGLKDGEHLDYFENGKLRLKVNWKDGRWEGEWREYWDNGVLMYFRNYKDGTLDGEWLSYNYNGQLTFKGNWKTVNQKVNG